MRKKHVVRLSEEEREICREAVRRLVGTGERVRRAQMLLKADADGPGWTDERIAEAYSCRRQTVENVRRRFVEAGFEGALERKRREAPPRILDGQAEAEVIALRLGPPPAGARTGRCGCWRARWSSWGSSRRSATRPCGRRQKNGVTGRKVQYRVIPPDADAEFAAGMEDVLETCALPCDADNPVARMDEQPVRLVRETRRPVEATADHPRRVDCEYERAGTASVFMFGEPLGGWRRTTARERRTKVDWALEMAELMEGRYAGRPKVTLACDNLNTHTRGAFHEAFGPERARSLVRRIEFRCTPKHGSWLNVAECELGAMTRQCLRDRRIGDLAQLRREIAAWSADVNSRQRGVDWQMRIGDARRKLKSVYPKILV